MLLALLAGYVTLCISLILIWGIVGIHSVYGDEPFYLEIAQRLVSSGTFEQVGPEHTVLTNRGFFSIHGLGLPVLIALPSLMSGDLLTRIAMVALSSMMVPFLWDLGKPIFASARARFVSIAVIVSSASFVTFAGQIYPDMVAGVALLGAITVLWRVPERRASWLPIWAVALMAFLPWVHIKYALPAGIITIALVLRSRGVNSVRRWTTILIFCASILFLFGWNWQIYGRFVGAYVDGSLQFSTTTLMVFLGLILDPNAGLLFMSPVLGIGILSLGVAWRRNRMATSTLLLVALVLLVENASHPNWYGGAGFAHRFSVSSAVILTAPALIGLAALFTRSHRWWTVVIAGLLSINALFWFMIGPLQLLVAGSLNLTSRGLESGLSTNSVFHPGIARFMPSFYSPDWFTQHLPNYAWVIVLVTVVVMGLFRKRILGNPQCTLIIVGTVISLLTVVLLAGYRTNVSLESLRTQVGLRFVPALNERGLVSIGPSAIVHRGSFSVEYEYLSEGPDDLPVGRWELLDTRNNSIISSGEIRHSGGETVENVEVFDWGSLLPQEVKIRFFWYGNHEFELKTIGIRTAVINHDGGDS